MMTKALVLYHSQEHGATGKMAEAVAAPARRGVRGDGLGHQNASSL